MTSRRNSTSSNDSNNSNTAGPSNKTPEVFSPSTYNPSNPNQIVGQLQIVRTWNPGENPELTNNQIITHVITNQEKRDREKQGIYTPPHQTVILTSEDFEDDEFRTSSDERPKPGKVHYRTDKWINDIVSNVDLNPKEFWGDEEEEELISKNIWEQEYKQYRRKLAELPEQSDEAKKEFNRKYFNTNAIPSWEIAKYNERDPHTLLNPFVDQEVVEKGKVRFQFDTPELIKYEFKPRKRRLSDNINDLEYKPPDELERGWQTVRERVEKLIIKRNDKQNKIKVAGTEEEWKRILERLEQKYNKESDNESEEESDQSLDDFWKNKKTNPKTGLIENELEEQVDEDNEDKESEVPSEDEEETEINNPKYKTPEINQEENESSDSEQSETELKPKDERKTDRSGSESETEKTLRTLEQIQNKNKQDLETIKEFFQTKGISTNLEQEDQEIEEQFNDWEKRGYSNKPFWEENKVEKKQEYEELVERAKRVEEQIRKLRGGDYNLYEEFKKGKAQLNNLIEKLNRLDKEETAKRFPYYSKTDEALYELGIKEIQDIEKEIKELDSHSGAYISNVLAKNKRISNKIDELAKLNYERTKEIFQAYYQNEEKDEHESENEEDEYESENDMSENKSSGGSNSIFHGIKENDFIDSKKKAEAHLGEIDGVVYYRISKIDNDEKRLLLRGKPFYRDVKDPDQWYTPKNDERFPQKGNEIWIPRDVVEDRINPFEFKQREKELEELEKKMKELKRKPVGSMSEDEKNLVFDYQLKRTQLLEDRLRTLKEQQGYNEDIVKRHKARKTWTNFFGDFDRETHWRDQDPNEKLVIFEEINGDSDEEEVEEKAPKGDTEWDKILRVIREMKPQQEMKWTDIPTFTGKEDPYEWLRDYEDACETNRITNGRKLRLLGDALKGPAKTWWKTIRNKVKHFGKLTTEPEKSFKYHFLLRYCGEDKQWEWANELRNIKMEKDESVDAYAERLRAAYNRADPFEGYPEYDRVCQFIKGLRLDIKIFTQAQAPKTFERALELAKQAESAFNASGSFVVGMSPEMQKELTGIKSAVLAMTNQMQQSQQPAKECALCYKTGHRPIDCPNRSMNQVRRRDYQWNNPRNRNQLDKEPKKCFNCRGTGHFARDCPAKICQICNRKGHIAKECNQYRNTQRPQILQRNSNNQGFNQQRNFNNQNRNPNSNQNQRRAFYMNDIDEEESEDDNNDAIRQILEETLKANKQNAKSIATMAEAFQSLKD